MSESGPPPHFSGEKCIPDGRPEREKTTAKMVNLHNREGVLRSPGTQFPRTPVEGSKGGRRIEHAFRDRCLREVCRGPGKC